MKTIITIIISFVFFFNSQKLSASNLKWPCLFPPSMSNDIPGDTKQSDQAGFNCLAWQQFIALNWPTNPKASASNFGEPNDDSPVVFETYMNIQEFLLADGSQPPDWKHRAYAQLDNKRKHTRKMFGTSKISLNFDPDQDLAEAFPSPSSKAWLADKYGNLVWYEILVNKDEFDYFYDNQFYNSMQQYKAASSGKHIDLPKGDLSGKVGAMEFKAAWLTVPNPNDSKWNRYKMTKANICSSDGQCQLQNFALVGLHIIHKTTSQASWIWSTFEHVDNSPDVADVGQISATDSYTFYDPNCIEKDIPPQCINGLINQKTSCKANVSPAYALSFVNGVVSNECPSYPIQVVREFPIQNTKENPVMATNKAAHQLIKDANNDSVYQYYNLVNVIWNDSPIDENKGATPPINSLSNTGFRPVPKAQPVANTVLETYIQSATCIDCHSFATINAPANGTEYASDYSFIFSMAHNNKSNQEEEE